MKDCKGTTLLRITGFEFEASITTEDEKTAREVHLYINGFLANGLPFGVMDNLLAYLVNLQCEDISLHLCDIRGSEL